MATEDQIAALRKMVAEADDSDGWTDEQLAAIIDEQGNLNTAAAVVWSLKAGQAVTLVDVSESGSSRKLGDIRKNALEMSAYYSGLNAAEVIAETPGPVIQRMRRTVA